MMRLGLLLILALLPLLVHAQKRNRQQADSVQITPGDTTLIPADGKVVTIDTYANRFNPRKALLFSAIFPGAGQFYNQKYWKIPIVFGLIAGGIYYLDYNTGLYNGYKAELFSLLSEPDPVVVNKDGVTPSGNLFSNNVLTSPISRLNTEQLRNAVNRYRRERDFSVLLMGIVYFAQLIDAHVDAHLKEFDVNPQMKVTFEPSVQPTGVYGRASGLSVKLKF